MKKYIIVALLLVLNTIASFAVAPKFKRFVKSQYGYTSVIDVMYLDRDGDGCYDYIVIWINGDYFTHETLLKAGGSGSGLPSEKVDEYEIEDLSISNCVSAPEQSLTFTLSGPVTADRVTVWKGCAGTVFQWSTNALAKQGLGASEDYELGKPTISAYPNPVLGDALTVSASAPCKMTGIDLVDVSGKSTVLQLGSLSDQSINTFNVGHLTPGVYLLRVQTTECGLLQTQILISSQGAQR